MNQTKFRKYFGTDGIRGRVGNFPINAEIALKIGIAVGIKFSNFNNQKLHRVVIGKDTRLSGYVIESAITAGLASVGIEVFLVGPLPTPAISMITKSMRADVGIMISASHNPYHDNGIKIFDGNGNKLSDEMELEIEQLIDSDLSGYFAMDREVGRVKRIEDARGRYIEFVKNSFPKDKSLEGLRIVVDCANGASYKIAGTIFNELGAETIIINNQPDGFNINEECGSTHLKSLQDKVKSVKADIGIALDGDADRLAVVDESGEVVHGDKIIALIAEELHSNGLLKQDTVVITQMSNLAIEKYFEYLGISTIRVGVGDRYVLEGIKNNNCNFGGEQSGHIVLNDFSSTGDGLVASLKLLSILKSSGKKMSDLAKIFNLNPHILINIKIANQSYNPLQNQDVLNLIKKEEEKIKKNGRILVRKSGTENLIRIMVEGENEEQINVIAEKIANFIKQQDK
ncbi:MAG: phosphoglucosamine mutase [Rickettsiales bacterium]|nr:phosphoglucosamine mutase [Rickettsiales bacterium]